MAGKTISVGISGRARTGKNTLAQMIVDNLDTHPKNYKIVAVADPIKNMILHMVPNADAECLWGQSELRATPLPGNLVDIDGKSLTYRRALMDIGSLGRQYNPDIWLNALVQDAKKNDNLEAYIVADLRFPNEINYLKDHNFFMVRIKRADIPDINDVSETAQLEIPDDFFHHTIENNGSLSDLNREAKLIVNKIALL